MKHSEVIAQLKNLANPEKAKHSTRFFKSGPGEYGEGDKFLGIKVPDQRKIAKEYRDLPANEIEKLLQNEFHEVRLTAVMLMTYKVEKGGVDELEEMTRLYLNNLPAMNNWDIVDSSCHKILGPFLEDKERGLLYDFAQSDDLWKKRIAMITTYHFIKQEDFTDTIKIAEILVDDDHDLIHKAVGWMLREVGNRDLETEEEFLRKYYQNMPRTMLRYAIEKLEEPLRLKYLHGEV
ncbi:MAG: DNA alkylation repair protein [Balneola sp.]|jgi:3-methyladenine DNA glycosylase AlkD|nr:DNA alkylation repair protein [Balneola sp.]MBE78269.1 DNA alkylation repair protein [Balneola sp.]HBX66367.1 DNA alkylation repair protein [Balneolaceae bacterium]|tara:strand:- start:2553 stop:3257 length:705 start_codon:yes stop_codon:yes gene_type:complete